ncbi:MULTISPECIES: helix-turn-helix domain-containing protein [Actinomycetes]
MSARKTPGPESSAQLPDQAPEKLPGEADLRMDAKTMKAFAHPLRMAMYSYLSDQGSATATQLAKHLDESTGQTSYHLRQLEKHGLVEEDPEKGTGRERWWKPSGFSLRAEVIQGDPSQTPMAQTVIQHQMQERLQTLRRWMTHIDEEPQRWIEASVDSTHTATMSTEEMRAMRDELMEVIARHTDAASERVKTSGPGEDDRRARVYLSVLPLPSPED